MMKRNELRRSLWRLSDIRRVPLKKSALIAGMLGIGAFLQGCEDEEDPALERIISSVAQEAQAPEEKLIAQAGGGNVVTSGAGIAWWNGSGKDMREAAQQAGKGIILYFESEHAEECIRMREETWPNFNDPAVIGKFIWKKVSPESDEKFFEYYDVYQTPELVVLDSDTKERNRIRGFVDADLLASIITSIDRGDADVKKDMIVLPDGTIASPDELAKREAEDDTAHFISENFNNYKTLNDTPPGFIDAYKNSLGTLGISEGEGRYSSNGLVVGANDPRAINLETHPAVAARINLSKGTKQPLDGVELVEGRLRLTFYARAGLYAEELSDAIALNIVPKGSPPPTVQTLGQSGLEQTVQLKREQSMWKQFEMVTRPFNFRSNDVYLVLWVDFPNWAFYFDDLKVDILPASAEIGSALSGNMQAKPDPLSIFDIVDEDYNRLDHKFRLLDANKDSRIFQNEVTPKLVNSLKVASGIDFNFKKFDKDGNGYIDYDEWQRRNE